MSDSDKVFAGSIPDIYDEYLVPMIFEPYAKDLAHRVNEIAPTNVLETAAGSGVVTRMRGIMLPISINQCWIAQRSNNRLIPE